MKRIKKLGIALVYVLLGTILVYNVYNVINLKILKKDVTVIGGYSMLEVVSGSMEPTIHVGDMIIINTNDKDYEVNDIVTFYDSNRAFVTHRIISKNGNLVITQGDNNNTPDTEFNTDRIVGKYVSRIQGLGFVLKGLQSPVTMLLILIVGILVCVLVSTDNEGKPLLSEEEREFEEFLRTKREKELRKSKVNKVDEILKEPKLEEIVDIEHVEVIRKPIRRPVRKVELPQVKPIEEPVKIEPVVLDELKTKTVKRTTNSKVAGTPKKTSSTKASTAKKTTSVATNRTVTSNVKKTTKKVASSSPKKVEGKKTTKATTKSKASSAATTKKATTTKKSIATAKKATTKTVTKTKTDKTKSTSSKKNNKKQVK